MVCSKVKGFSNGVMAVSMKVSLFRDFAVGMEFGRFNLCRFRHIMDIFCRTKDMDMASMIGAMGMCMRETICRM